MNYYVTQLLSGYRDFRKYLHRMRIRPWIGKKFEEVNYCVTQLLSGYVYFRKYLHRMRKTTSNYCLCEEGEIIYDAEHIAFE